MSPEHNALPDPELELFFEKKVAALSSIFLASRKRLMASLALADDGGTSDRQIIAQIDRELERLSTAIRNNAKEAIDDVFAHQLDVAGRRLSDFGAQPRVGLQGAFSQINVGAVAVIADQMADDLLVAAGSVRRESRTFLRLTRQSAVEEVTLNRLIAQGMVEGAPIRTTVQRVANEIRTRIGNGQLIRVGSKHYKPEDYAAIVARVRISEAASQAAINATAAFGEDLVQVSVHVHDDKKGDRCPMFAGRVYSISGRNPDFPVLTAERTPPYHPNCRHRLLTQTLTALKVRGEYETLSRFSKRSEGFSGGIAAYQELFS